MTSWFVCGGIEACSSRAGSTVCTSSSQRALHDNSANEAESGASSVGSGYRRVQDKLSLSCWQPAVDRRSCQSIGPAHVDVRALASALSTEGHLQEDAEHDVQELEFSASMDSKDELAALRTRIEVLERLCLHSQPAFDSPAGRLLANGAPDAVQDPPKAMGSAVQAGLPNSGGTGLLGPVLSPAEGEQYIPKASIGAGVAKDVLNEIYEKPYKHARDRGAYVGSGILAVLTMPFGPIGMAAGGVLGWMCGGFVGFMVDRRTTHVKTHESNVQLRRLHSLMRWADQRSSEADTQEELFALVETVILEFKPIADVAEGSDSARRMLILLNNWISRRKVSHALWSYMDSLLLEWRTLSRGQFMKSLLVFQTLSVMYRVCPRALGEQECAFVEQMNALLSHSSIKLVMEHANAYPTEVDTKVMECMVYADALGRHKAPSKWHNLSPCMERRTGRMATRTKSPSSHKESPFLCLQPGEALDLEAQQASDLICDDVLSADSQMERLDAEEVNIRDGCSVPEKGKKPEKPFFKGWQDFMDFDVNVKHKMAITASEFGLLLQQASLSTAGWDVCVDRKEIKVCKVQSGERNVSIRAWATVPDVHMNVAFKLFYDSQDRVSWDKVFNEFRVLEQTGAGSDIIYSLIRAPGVTAREFVQFRRVRVQEDGSIVIVLRSADHAGAAPRKDAIRVESYIAGYILRQEYECGKPVLKIFIMSCCDVKGMIPKWIINYMAPKKPAEWCDSLRNAALEYQRNHPNHKELLKELLDGFCAERTYTSEPIRMHSLQ